MNGKFKLVSGFAVVAAILFAVTLFFQQPREANGLPILGEIADFSLYDSKGEKFGLKNLSGKIWVADFIFTTCGGICPMMTQNLQGVYREHQGNPSVHFVSVSVNPEYDSSDVLHQYAQDRGINIDVWHFLTGDLNIIKDMAVNSFKLGSIDEPVFHSGYFVLVDSSNRIRGYYDGLQKNETKRLSSDINRLLGEEASR